jgi:hypothetical protein
MTRRRTRAWSYGVKTAVLKARAKREIAKMRAAIERLSADWGDVFGPVVFDCDELGDKITTLEATIDEGAEYLKEADDAE